MLQPITNIKQGIKKRYHRNFGPYRDLKVISFPKSGRTWLRVMLNDLNINPTYDHNGSQNALNRPYWELSADKSHYSPNRVIFMVRDPRDTVVSAYFQMTKRHESYNGSISDFIRDDRYGIKKILKFHDIWYKNCNVPEGFKLVKYEDLHGDPFKEMNDLLEFLKVKNIDQNKLQRIIQFYQFNNMHKLEKQGYFKNSFKGVLYPKDVNDKESFKTRKGKVGGFNEYFSDEDIEYCSQVMKEFPNPFYSNVV